MATTAEKVNKYGTANPVDDPLYYNRDLVYNRDNYQKNTLPAPVPGNVKMPDPFDVQLKNFTQGIAKEETGGAKNPYAVTGPKTKSGDHAYGKYQVMGAYIPSWTKQYLGKSMTINQFKNDPQAQEALMTARAKDLYNKHKNWADVANVWFTGQPASTSGVVKDVTGTTNTDYVGNVLNFMRTLVAPTASAATLDEFPKGGSPTDAPKQNLTQSLTDAQIKQNIDTMRKQNVSTDKIQAYVNNYQKSPDGSYSLKGSGPTQQTVLASNEGLGQFLTDAIMSVPKSTADVLGGIAKTAAEAPLRIGATTAAGIKTAQLDIAGDPNAYQDAVKAGANSPIQPYTNVHDYMAGLLDTGSWFIGGPEGKAVAETAVQTAKAGAEKGAAQVITDVGKRFAQPFLGGGSIKDVLTAGMGAKQAGTFAALQGGAAYERGKGKGESGTQATTEGLLGGVGSLATLAGLGIGAKTSGYAADIFSRSAAAKYTQNFFQSSIEGMQHAITEGMRGGSAETVVRSVQDATKQFGNGMKNFFNELSKKSGGMFKSLPDAQQGMSKLLGGVYENLSPMRSALRQGFSEVFNNAPVLVKGTNYSDDLITAFNDAKTAAGQAVTEGEQYAKDQADARAGVLGTDISMSPTLDKYLARFQNEVMHPLQTDGHVPMTVLNNVIHFLDPKGNPTETAIGTRLQDALYKAFSDNIKEHDPALATKWDALRTQYKTISSTWDGLLKDVFTDANDPESLAGKFIDGAVAVDPTKTDMLNRLLGPQGVETLMSYINKTLTERAGNAYNTIARHPTPENLDNASKYVTGMFDKAMTNMEKGNSNYGEFVPAEMLNMWQSMRNVAGNDIWQLGTTAADHGLLAKDGVAELKALYENLKGGSKAFTAALQSPAKLTESITKMAPEEIRGVKTLIGDKTVTGKDGTQVRAWDVVSASVLKDIISKASSAFGKNADVDVVESLRKELESIGGAQKDEVLNELFGGYSGMNLKEGLQGLFDALEFSKSVEGRSGSAIKGMAHGAASFFFMAIHHPMFAAGEARQSIKAFSQMSSTELEAAFTRGLEKNGKLPMGPFRTLLSGLRKVLQLYPVQQLLGRDAPYQASPPDATSTPLETSNQPQP